MAEIILQPKQFEVLNSPATEILYGGAAYGGKSYLMRAVAVALCYDIPGLQVYLFRRTYPDLMANHMNGSGSFIEMLAPFVATKQVTIKQDEITWSNGSKIHLCHCQHEKDVLKYQGAEIHVLLIDELTSFTEYIYRFLRNRVRLGSRAIPDRWKHKLPLIIAGSNPGGVGHAWVKRSFIEMADAGAIRKMESAEGGMMRQFIQSKSEHNPIGMKNDPGYIDRLTGLGSDDLVRAMRDGDWDIVAGAAFENLSRDKHMIRPFEVKHWWTKFTSLDWGSSKPYAVGWFTINDETLVIRGRDGEGDKLIGKGSIIMYRELYGWNGRPDEGCREESWEVAKKIKNLEPSGEVINYRIADSAMWSVHDGPSIAERMMDALDYENATCPNMEQSRKDRVANYLEIRNRLSNSDGENPGFYIFENCHHFWRTVPDLQLDQRDPEKGWDTSQEDHICFVAGTPIITLHGIKNIEDIKNDIVLTGEGWKRCQTLGQTGISKTLKIILSDGFSFEATSSHPILTPSGAFVRLDSLREGDKVICASRWFPSQSKFLMARAIGYAAITFNVMARDFIGLYGNTITERFQRASTFIIRIMTEAITKLRIWNCFTNPSICHSIWKKFYQHQKAGRMRARKWMQRVSMLLYGIKAKKGDRGIARLNRARKWLLSIKELANIVTRLLTQPLKLQCFAQIIATQRITEKHILSIIPNNSEQPVYNLSVKGVENYALGNGLIVHNCDMVGYALVSRPLVMDRKTYGRQQYDEARDKAFRAESGATNSSRY